MALTADGRLVELQIARRDRPSPVDGVFLGRLERVMPDLDAAFVDIGTGRSGFLRARIAPASTAGRRPARRCWCRCATTARATRVPRLSHGYRGVGPLSRLSPAGLGRELLAPHRRRIRTRAAGRPCRRHARGRDRAAHRGRRRVGGRAAGRCEPGDGALGAAPPARARCAAAGRSLGAHSRRSAIRSNGCCATTARGWRK